MNALYQFLENRFLWIAVSAWAAAQLIKVVIGLIRTRRFDKSLLISAGGMPSSHSAIVMALTVSVGKYVGFDSPIFAICAVVSFVVMYDAAGVRRAAGKQAAVINSLVELVEEQGFQLDKKLKELLGHSPIEVAAGAILGILIAGIVA